AAAGPSPLLPCSDRPAAAAVDAGQATMVAPLEGCGGGTVGAIGCASGAWSQVEPGAAAGGSSQVGAAAAAGPAKPPSCQAGATGGGSGAGASPHVGSAGGGAVSAGAGGADAAAAG